MKLLHKGLLEVARAGAILAAIVALVGLAFNPDLLTAEEPCEFGGPGGSGWECVELPHVFQGQCEGIDCYTAMEFCCLRLD